MNDFIKRDFDFYDPIFDNIGYLTFKDFVACYYKARKRYEKRCLKRGIVNRIYK